MEEKYIQFIREYFDVPADTTDEDIGRLDVFLKETPWLRRPDFMQVGNLVELRSLRKICYPAKPEPFIPPYGENLFWLFCCESLFVEGHYGPCCIWARATIEFELQELCLLDPEVPEEFKAKIRNPEKRGTPGIDACLNKLGDSLCSEGHNACDVIKNNGDYVVHHRLDKIMGVQSPEDLLREWGVSEKNINAPGFKDKRPLMKAARYNRERIRAKESMKSLYEFDSRRSPVH